MKHNHNMILDILPLYVDGVCSEESAAAVQEHLAECVECRSMLEDMKSEPSTERPHLDSTEVIKRTGRKITSEAVLNVIGVSVIVLYWIIYAIMTPFANVGDYRNFSYSIWEIWSLGFILMPLFNAVWLILVIYKAIKSKEWKKRVAILLVLTFLLIGQVGIEYVRSQETSTVSVGWIDEVGEGCFVFNNGMDATKILCSYELTGLLKSDGTMYVITYYSNRLFPDKSTLSTVEEAGYNRSQTRW